MVVGFGTEARRREALMWRHIVHRELGADAIICYDKGGAPEVVNRREHIGVSHSTDFVAVIISERRCAVDIERLDRNFEQVAPRYIHPEEQTLCSDSRWPAVIWSAKETLYKYIGERGLNFLRDIRILEVDFKEGFVVGQIRNYVPVKMQMKFHSDNIVVYVG